jgi:hypothetical protein
MILTIILALAFLNLCVDCNAEPGLRLWGSASRNSQYFLNVAPSPSV